MKYKYQFYEGRAFVTPEGMDYSDRRNKIEAEINDAINYMNSLNPQSQSIGTINKEFVLKLISSINNSLKEEKKLYDAMGMTNYPKLIRSVDDFDSKISIMKNIAEQVTKYFMPNNNKKERGKIYFLDLLNDEGFLSYISMQITTRLSYTDYGNKNRTKGKTIITEALSTAMKSGVKASNRPDQIIKLIEKDIIRMSGQTAEIFEDLPKQVREDITNIVINTIDEHFNTAKGFKGKKIMYIANAERLKRLSTQKGETLTKTFYKDLYSIFEKYFRVNVEEDVRKYLNGALIMSRPIHMTTYGAEVLANIYLPDENSKSGYGKMKQGLIFDDFLSETFIPFLVRNIASYSTNIKHKEELKSFVNSDSFKKKIFNVLKRAYTKKFNNKEETEEEKIRHFVQFSKSNISGLLGEIGAAFALSIHDHETIVIGDTKNSLGQKMSSDIQLIVAKKENRKIVTKEIVGIQVKNYTSSDTVNLYGNTKVGLGENTMKRYISPKDLRIFRFLVANKEFANKMLNKNITKEDLMGFLYIHYDSFLRINDLSDNMNINNISNSFYYINNKIYPASLFLLSFLKQIQNIVGDVEKVSQNIKNPIFEIKGNFPNYLTIDSAIKGHSYQKISARDQPKATKIINPLTGRRITDYAYSSLFGGENIRTPIEIDKNKNLVNDIIIHFKGLTVKTRIF